MKNVRNFGWILFGLLLAGFWPVAAHAENQANGSTILPTQTMDGTWGPGTLNATADVTIQTGVTITIAAGTVIEISPDDDFAGGIDSTRIEFIVQNNATLRANGESGSNVVFTSSVLTPMPADWYGLRYLDGSSGYLHFTEIAYATHGITIDTSNAIDIADSDIHDNADLPDATRDAFGAGLYLAKGDHTVERTSIHANSAVAQPSYDAIGAGIYIVSGSPHINQCQIFQNSLTASDQTASGSGIAVAAGGALIEQSHIYQNTINGGSNNNTLKCGAGICIMATTAVEVRLCWIEGNSILPDQGYGGGGGIGLGPDNSSALLIENNVISDNLVAGAYWCEGAGIDLWAGIAVTVRNNLIVGNTTGVCGNGSPFGGGIMSNGGGTGAIIVNNTIVGNQAISGGNGRGGGAYIQLAGGNPTFSTSFYNNIVSGNSAGNLGGGIAMDNSAGTVDYNDIFGNSAPQNPQTAGNMGSNNLASDPQFVGFGDDANYYHIKPSSPAINAALGTAPGIPNFDFDNQSRPLLGTNYDMGFDEVDALTFLMQAQVSTAAPGDTVAYLAYVGNNGAINATNVSLTITVPVNTDFAAGGWSCVGSVCTLAMGTMNAGSDTTFTFPLVVHDPFPGKSVVLAGTLTYTLGSPQTLAQTDTVGISHPPTDMTLSNNSVSNHRPIGTLVGTFTTTDVDVGESYTYALASGAGSDNNTDFYIQRDQLFTQRVFDYATKNLYSIRVKSTDAAGANISKQFTISILNNLAPTNLTLSATSVAENQPVATAVGTFTTTDPDAGDTHSYFLVPGAGGADNAFFGIAVDQLVTNAAFDYEARSTYHVRVRTMDAAGAFLDKAFTISITNVNEAPTNISLSPSSVVENQSAGTTVGTFSTVDPDAGDTFTYALVLGAGSSDNGSFTLGGNTLYTAAVFDFETKNSYSIRVRSTDAGGLYTEKVLTVSVSNVNEAPTDLTVAPATVDENLAVGVQVGTFSTTDPDVVDTHTYALVAGAGSDDNSQFTISGGMLFTAAAFNYEAKSSYTIRVRTVDTGGLAFEKVLIIAVGDVNEAPTDLFLSSTSVSENQAIGTAVGTFASADPDAGDTHTYSLVAGVGADDNNSFVVVGDELSTNAVFDYEATSSYKIRVRTTDAGGLTFERQFTINIADVNDAPTDLTLTPTSVAEDALVGTAVGTFSSVDQDAGNSFTYSLVAGAGSDDNGQFTINGNALLTVSVFDYETKSMYLIRVRTTDAGGLFFEKQLAVNILNVNDNAPVVSDQVLTISEDVSVRTSLGVISATDADGDILSFVITDGAIGLFEIDAATGELFYNASAPLSYKITSQYVLSLDVSDGLHTTSTQITVQVVAAGSDGAPALHQVVRHGCSCSGGGEMSFVDSMAFLALVLFRRRTSKRSQVDSNSWPLASEAVSRAVQHASCLSQRAVDAKLFAPLDQTVRQHQPAAAFHQPALQSLFSRLLGDEAALRKKPIFQRVARKEQIVF